MGDVVAYWQDGDLLLHNYKTGTVAGSSPLVLEILESLSDWTPAAALQERFRDYPARSFARLIDELAGLSLIERRVRTASANRARERAAVPWDSWGVAASFFHFSTKDVEYTPGAIASEQLRAKTLVESPPSALKRRSGARQHALPPAPIRGELPSLLRSRRTWRRFDRAPLPQTCLSALLGLTWGVQSWVELPAFGRMALKNSPSGGARHSVEVYLLALRVRGLRPGIYHYDPDRHVLSRLRRRLDARDVAAYLPTQEFYSKAAALFVMTSVFARVGWRYPFARAYRTVLAEAGHLCQNFCLVATWLKLAPFCTMALADTRLEQDLQIDGISESVLYVAGVGARPEGVEWAPRPGSEKVPQRSKPAWALRDL